MLRTMWDSLSQESIDEAVLSRLVFTFHAASQQQQEKRARLSVVSHALLLLTAFTLDLFTWIKVLADLN